MKIVHLTDLHVQTPPRVRDLFGKRIVGSANLYLLGRRAKFAEASQRAAVAATLAEEPDAVVITGDLTAQALDAEFSAARALLDPVLARFPTVILAGNHDTYVREPSPGARLRQVFGPWMGPRSPHLHRVGEVAFLAIETCRAHPLSSGRVPPGELDAARRLLAADDAAFTFLCLHYPLRGRDGEPYRPATRALSNAAEVERFLLETDRIGAVLHGHEHHGFRTEVPGAAGPVPVFDPGAAGYARLPERGRTAHLNVYEVEGGALRSVRRLALGPGGFVEEPGGAYASGG